MPPRRFNVHDFQARSDQPLQARRDLRQRPITQHVAVQESSCACPDPRTLDVADGNATVQALRDCLVAGRTDSPSHYVQPGYDLGRPSGCTKTVWFLFYVTRMFLNCQGSSRSTSSPNSHSLSRNGVQSP